MYLCSPLWAKNARIVTNRPFSKNGTPLYSQNQVIMQVELILLVLSLLFFVSIFTDKVGYKFGVPALLLFLAVGMLFGADGIGKFFNEDGMGYMLNIDSAQVSVRSPSVSFCSRAVWTPNSRRYAL